MLRIFVHGATHHFVDSQILLKIANDKRPSGECDFLNAKFAFAYAMLTKMRNIRQKKGKKMKLYHLSHIDLDGYGCQLITNEYFKDKKYYNSNYGNEITQKIEQIFNDIENDDKKEPFILITDLNLTLEQADKLDKRVKESPRDIKLLLLDHHKTGLECSKKYEWYFLDEKRCATKITYDHFSKEFYPNEKLKKFSDVTNAIDIWLTKDKHFELGKVCLKLVSDAREVNRVMFPKENNEYIFSMIENSYEYYDKTGANIALDNALHKLKKKFFKGFSKDDTLDNLVSKYVVDLLTKKKDEMSIDYKGAKGILTYAITNVSVIGNDFLVKNPDFDFFLNINARRNISLRGNGKVDVSVIASELGEGGGHANASGGIIKSFKDSFLYENIKKQVEDAIYKVTNKK